MSRKGGGVSTDKSIRKDRSYRANYTVKEQSQSSKSQCLCLQLQPTEGLQDIQLAESNSCRDCKNLVPLNCCSAEKVASTAMRRSKWLPGLRVLCFRALLCCQNVTSSEGCCTLLTAGVPTRSHPCVALAPDSYWRHVACPCAQGLSEDKQQPKLGGSPSSEEQVPLVALHPQFLSATATVRLYSL